MKSTRRNDKVLLAFVIIQTIGGIVLAFFLYNFLTDPTSAFNRNISERLQIAIGQFKPLEGIKGDKGDTGEPGKNGLSIVGPTGQTGATGATGAQGVQGIQGIQGEQGLKGETGMQGPQGEPGPAQEKAEFRCNSQTAQLEYKYPSDEDWTNVGSTCVPNGGTNETQRK